MPTIGLITEGPTDFQVLRLFLNGLCGSEAVITPLSPVAQDDGSYPPTGWGNVLRYVGDPEFGDALNNRDFPVDFVVVHLDSDSCEDFTPSVRHVTGNEEEIIHDIKQRLVQEMEQVAPHFWADNSPRILFAITVRSTECWLLPLFFNDNTRTKTENCITSLNFVLRRYNFSIDPKKKQVGYGKLLRLDELKPRNLKHEKVLEISKHNPGFEDFAAQVKALINQPTPTEPEAA